MNQLSGFKNNKNNRTYYSALAYIICSTLLKKIKNL